MTNNEAAPNLEKGLEPTINFIHSRNQIQGSNPGRTHERRVLSNETLKNAGLKFQSWIEEIAVLEQHLMVELV